MNQESEQDNSSERLAALTDALNHFEPVPGNISTNVEKLVSLLGLEDNNLLMPSEVYESGNGELIRNHLRKWREATVGLFKESDLPPYYKALVSAIDRILQAG